MGIPVPLTPKFQLYNIIGRIKKNPKRKNPLKISLSLQKKSVPKAMRDSNISRHYPTSQKTTQH